MELSADHDDKDIGVALCMKPILVIMASIDLRTTGSTPHIFEVLSIDTKNTRSEVLSLSRKVISTIYLRQEKTLLVEQAHECYARKIFLFDRHITSHVEAVLRKVRSMRFEKTWVETFELERRRFRVEYLALFGDEDHTRFSPAVRCSSHS